MLRITMLVLLVLAIAHPCHAQWGYPVQTVYDSGYSYTLYSSGNISRSGGWGGSQLIDNGTGTRMLAAGMGYLYVLKNNGQVWTCVDPYSMQWQPQGGGWRPFARAASFSRLHNN